jgi:hypothetical protein
MIASRARQIRALREVFQGGDRIRLNNFIPKTELREQETRG